MADGGRTYRETGFAATPDMNLYVREFGDPASPKVPLIALHGYWRTSRDFEELAEHLAPSRYILTPDMRGRGRSGRSTDVSDYAFERLVDDIARLLAARGIARAVFLGTALGAYVAMRLWQLRPELLAGFIFNDTGPEAPPSAGAKAATFSGGDERSFDEALAMIKAQNAPGFTRYGDAEWVKMTRRAYWQNENGAWVRDFDQLTNQDIPRMRAVTPDFWQEYNAISVPIAVLRGENSEFLTRELADRMVAANPHTTIYTIPGCGHPPMLWEPESYAAVDEFLARVDG